MPTVWVRSLDSKLRDIRQEHTNRIEILSFKDVKDTKLSLEAAMFLNCIKNLDLTRLNDKNSGKEERVTVIRGLGEAAEKALEGYNGENTPKDLNGLLNMFYKQLFIYALSAYDADECRAIVQAFWSAKRKSAVAYFANHKNHYQGDVSIELSTQAAVLLAHNISELKKPGHSECLAALLIYRGSCDTCEQIKDRVGGLVIAEALETLEKLAQDSRISLNARYAVALNTQNLELGKRMVDLIDDDNYLIEVMCHAKKPEIKEHARARISTNGYKSEFGLLQEVVKRIAEKTGG